MRDSWKRLNTWAYGLRTGRRWKVWVTVATLAAIAQTFVPSPWHWLVIVPCVVFGFVLFDSHARRQRDDVQERTQHP